MLRFVALVALLSATAQAQENFKQIFDDHSALIGVKLTENFALDAPELKQLNWASVSVNKDQLTMVTPECKIIERGFDDLGEDERRILEQTIERMLNSNLDNSVSFNGNSINFRTSIPGISSYNFKDFTMQKIGNNHYSFRADSLAAENISWLMVHNDVITFIFSNSRIQMQPRSCLDADKQKMVQDMMVEFEREKAKSDKEREERDATRERQLREREAERARRQQERERYQQERERERQQRDRERQERHAERDREREQRRLEQEQRRQQRYQSRGYY